MLHLLFKRVLPLTALPILVASVSVQAAPGLLAQSPTARSPIFLPFAPNNLSSASRPLPSYEGVRPTGGNCPAGYHLETATGIPGWHEVDTVEYSDQDYVCVLNDLNPQANCGPYGELTRVNGNYACACAEGYVGETCNLCAPGYTFNPGSLACEITPVDPETPILGGDESLEWDEEVVLIAGPTGDPHNWEISPGGEGCLLENSGDPCATSLDGLGSVIFKAPASSDKAVGMTEIVLKNPANNGAVGKKTLVFVQPGGMPVTGSGSAQLQPVVDALAQFMRYRCVGGGVVGISYYGKVVGVWGLGKKDGRNAQNIYPGCGDDSLDPYLAAAPKVGPDTPFRIGSNSKAVTAAITRLAIRQKWMQLNPGSDPTYAEIEALNLVNPVGLGSQLIDPQLRDILARVTPPPYFYDLDLGVEGYADENWVKVTVGDLLGHTAGLKRDPPSYTNSIVPTLAWLRGLWTIGDFATQDALLQAQYGPLTVDLARAQLAAASGQSTSDIYFLPRPTGREVVLAVTGTRFKNDPDDNINEYSNIDPPIWQMINEYLTGLPYSAELGEPASHEGSLVDLFFEQDLGVNTTGQSGIFRSQAAFPRLPTDPEPRYRGYVPSQNTYTPLSNDSKRPHCFHNGNGVSCVFDSWVDESFGRANWNWGLGLSEQHTNNANIWPESGLLAAEPAAYLKFMSKYWVGGYGADPLIGEQRVDASNKKIWNAYVTHNGALDGTLSWVLQLGNSGPTTFNLPPRTSNGSALKDEFTGGYPTLVLGNLSENKVEHYAFGVPNGFAADSIFSPTPFSDMAVGSVLARGGDDRAYLVDEAADAIRVRSNDSSLYANYLMPIASGEKLVVADLDNDIFAEMILYHPQFIDGELRFFDHDGTSLGVHSPAGGSGAVRQVAVGDIHGDGKVDIITVRNTVSGNLYVLQDFRIGPLYTGFSPNIYLDSSDQIAMGIVMGQMASKDDLVVGRAATGNIEIYNYTCAGGPCRFDLYTTITGAGFEAGSTLAVSDYSFEGSRQYLAVGIPSTGHIRVYQAKPSDDTFFKLRSTIKEFIGDGPFTAGDPLAFADSFGGISQYICSRADGVKRTLPPGVDIFVAINQRGTGNTTGSEMGDKICTEDDDYNCGSAYGRLYDFIHFGACQASWNFVQPLDPVILP